MSARTHKLWQELISSQDDSGDAWFVAFRSALDVISELEQRVKNLELKTNKAEVTASPAAASDGRERTKRSNGSPGASVSIRKQTQNEQQTVCACP
jgi:hypothetical protein